MKVLVYWAAVVVALALVAAAGGGQVAMAAVRCSPAELSSCASAITTASPPSRLCCRKLREQKPCLCNYLKNPTLGKFVNTPNARKVAAACRTPFPKC
ncbi:hypothetical protein Nepgr_002927 [Nepenthes gracilis]|uniref:Bifunctional inhibitor/plant lipid transfer protein/seed storage helical domain-containing protein n=1 Tax=Nepenthes gracilis TaxID=150966 RepID=A0AAD3P9G1_NEPGR|nr:hypothetical protein Nepgr_002927 [Nepenthes gracilis]